MCVAESLLDLCNEMSRVETKSSAKIVCISARDRMECIDKIKERKADFGMVDPEDMYVASQIDDKDFAVFEEIRTKVEPEAEFRYEAVAVVHKDLPIKSISDLKGLKSCHTGVGRNVGYKVPLTKLKNMGIIGQLNVPELSPRENELKAFSVLFDKACIVGKWSPDPKIDSKWKKRYSNLCELCEEPDKCDYPDKFSGYEGALGCLVHNGGQIAWTKVIYVHKFFGLPIGITPSQPTGENPSDYRYLCPDGTKVPIGQAPCRWAARPWQGYISNTGVIKTINELRRKIENLGAVGFQKHSKWLEKVLEINDKSLVHENKVLGPRDYLDKANYTDVLERDYGPPFKTIRFCVTSNEEMDKCRTLSKISFSRNIRPRFDCVQEQTVFDCFRTIQENGADIVTVDASLAAKAQFDNNLKPILAEQYSTEGGTYYAVAVVRKTSKYQSLQDLKGAKSCHTGIGRTAGYNAPLYQLIKHNLIDKKCPKVENLAQFFGSSCLPGAKDKRHKIPENIANKLCSLCAGDLENKDVSKKCNFDQTESFSGYTGAFRCLVQGQGDVAFVKHVTVPGNTDGNNLENWAKDLKSEDFELLCPDGGRASVKDYKKCFMAQAPPHMVLTGNLKTDADIDEITSALLSASQMFKGRPDWFQLFGPFKGKKDLLFKDSATGLVSITGESEVQKAYNDVLATVNSC